VADAANFDRIGDGIGEEEPVVADAQPHLFSPLESLHVSRARFRKTVQRGENVHRGGLTQAADIGLGEIGTDDLFDIGS
jgi:hypothetical protein